LKLGELDRTLLHPPVELCHVLPLLIAYSDPGDVCDNLQILQTPQLHVGIVIRRHRADLKILLRDELA
jgi:hypothetical protein